MDKTQQQTLTRWLKQQSGPAKKWLRVLTLLGIVNGLIIIAQAWLLASVLHSLIMEQSAREPLIPYFIALIVAIIGRALLAWLREKMMFQCGEAVRKNIRSAVLDKLQQLGPIWIMGKPVGSWTTLVLEQIEDLQDFYARYLPQVALAGIIPLMILVAVFPTNWAAGVILLVTAPLIPLFMALVGNGAAEANRRNFTSLSRLSGNFLDRLKGIDTLRLFYQGEREVKHIERAAEDFRLKTMEVLKLAFLSSALLEFFASVSIAVVAVYFGFSYLGDLDFGHYGVGVTLFAGFLVLILAPEFFQPLRDLGAFYHAKAQAVGAAESLAELLHHINQRESAHEPLPDTHNDLTIIAKDLVILSPQGMPLTEALSFRLGHSERVAVVGHSGAGKSTLCHLLLGFLDYQGSITVNNIELKNIDGNMWRKQLSWVGQNPYLPEQTLRENILLAYPEASEQQLDDAIRRSYVDEFLSRLPEGLETKIGDDAARLSVGQAQRIAVARALLAPCHLLLLDEPTASLDATSETYVMQALNEASRQQTTLMITHQFKNIADYDLIWVMRDGKIVQTGTYRQLSQSDGYFAQLLAMQREAL
jgi:ATP-binding cassette subfamily C protein CydD